MIHRDSEALANLIQRMQQGGYVVMSADIALLLRLPGRQVIAAIAIDAGAEALRQRLQGGKTLRPWRELPNSSKRKWREYATLVLEAASQGSAGAIG